MKKLIIASLTAASMLVSAAASANWMYIDVGTNWYDDQDAANVSSNGDANTTTGLFDEFGFNQLLATSIYDVGDGSLFGSFYDTNIVSELNDAGIPGSGLVLPNCPAQCDLNSLNPLIPPILSNQDGEGFLATWQLLVEYHFDGVLTTDGPDYTGGYFNIIFDDRTALDNDRIVVTGTLTGSVIDAANLNLFFDITFAETGFLWIDNGSGNFFDASAGILDGNYAQMVIDTNVNPPIPTPDQMTIVGTNAIRQTTLDGSVTARIPEPASLTMLGLGLLGLVAAGRRQRKN